MSVSRSTRGRNTGGKTIKIYLHGAGGIYCFDVGDVVCGPEYGSGLHVVVARNLAENSITLERYNWLWAIRKHVRYNAERLWYCLAYQAKMARRSCGKWLAGLHKPDDSSDR